MTTAFQANAFQNNAFQIDSGPTPFVRPDTAPNLPGGGAQGMRGRTSQSLLRKRQRREEDEVAMIVEAVMPLLDGRVGEAQVITLGARDVKRDN